MLARVLALFDLVPGWVYALVVVGLVSCLLWSGLLRARTDTELAQVRADWAEARAAAVAEVASAVQAGVQKERAARVAQEGVVNELQTQIMAGSDRVAALQRRLRDTARTASSAGGGDGAPGATASSPGDGDGGAGLRGLAGADPLWLDGQAQGELAQLAVKANDTGATLKACRVLLRQAWTMTGSAP